MNRRVAHGAAIRAIREAIGISVSAFAPRVDCSQGYISNVELGNKQPSPTVMAAIARELGVPLDAVSYVIPACEHLEKIA